MNIQNKEREAMQKHGTPQRDTGDNAPDSPGLPHIEYLSLTCPQGQLFFYQFAGQR